MQNVNSGSGDTVSASEAQEILASLATRMGAQSVDPGIGSVQGLAAGLGVSEDHVRQMLEDIRVQKRSQQLAAGILDQQQQQRKRSDINAAFIAAAVLVVMALLAIPIFLLANRGSESLPPSAAPVATGPGVVVRPFNPPAAPNAPGSPVMIKTGSSVLYTGVDGHTISAEGDNFLETFPGGATVEMRGQQAIEHVGERIKEEQKKIETLTGGKDNPELQEPELKRAKDILSALEDSKKVLESSSTLPPN